MCSIIRLKLVCAGINQFDQHISVRFAKKQILGKREEKIQSTGSYCFRVPIVIKHGVTLCMICTLKTNSYSWPRKAELLEFLQIYICVLLILLLQITRRGNELMLDRRVQSLETSCSPAFRDVPWLGPFMFKHLFMAVRTASLLFC